MSFKSRTRPVTSCFVAIIRPAQAAANLLCLIAFLLLCVRPEAQDVVTSRYDNAKTGHQPAETILNPSNLDYSKFGKVLTFAVDGDVYAQPLYLSQYPMADGSRHNVLFVATQRNWVYAIDADGNNPATGYLWRTSLLGPGETWVGSADVGTLDIQPDIGITGTPVIDRARGTLYAVAKSNSTDTSTLRGVTQRLHALDLGSGVEKQNGPTVIQASVAGSGDGGTVVVFNPLTQNQRPGLVLAAAPGSGSTATVYVAWASHGDSGVYHGWILGYNAADISKQTEVFCNTPDGSDGGIWMSANGLAADPSGVVYAAAGNGSFDADSGGRDFGSSVASFVDNGSGLRVHDWLSPHDTQSLNAVDLDFGTSGPMLIPDQPGSHPHLLVTSDKSGKLYLVDRDNFGHFNNSYNADLQEWSDGGYTIHSNFAWFNNYLYLAPDGGPIQAYSYSQATQLFGTSPQMHSKMTFGGNGGDGAGSNLVISSNGTQNGVAWAIDYSDYGNGPLILHAFDAANLSKELYNSSQAAQNRDLGPGAIKFASPTVAGGRVYLGGKNAVVAYGLFQPQLPPTLSPYFSVASGTYSAPQLVTLSDATPGATIFYTTDGSLPTAGSSIFRAPITIAATTTLLAVAQAPGQTISAVSSSAYVITPAPAPTDPINGFSVGAMHLNGSTILSGSRLRLTDGNIFEAGSAFSPAPISVAGFVSDFFFQISNPAADGIAFVIQNSGASALGAFGQDLGFGGIPHSVAVKFDLYDNSGEGTSSTGLYLNGARPVSHSTDLTSAGIDLHSGHVMKVHADYNGTLLRVTIEDTWTGIAAQQQYILDIPAVVGGTTAYVGFTGGTGGLTATQEVLSWTMANQPVIASTALPNYPEGFATSALALNGGAVVVGSHLRLTDGGQFESRSAYEPNPVDITRFHSAFTFQLTEPVADGFTFVLQRAGLAAVGYTGGGLGYGPDTPGGMPGIPNSLAIKFDLYNNNSEGANSTGLYVNGASPSTPSTDLNSSGLDLHSGHVFAATIDYTGTRLTVSLLDTVTGVSNTQTYNVDIPATLGGTSAFAGFTAGTGGLTATQDILSWVFTQGVTP